MPITSSAKKANRQNVKNRQRNTRFKDLFTEARKSFEKDIKDQNKKGILESYKLLQSTIDKLAKKNIIHKNNASRKKSRYAKILKSVIGEVKTTAKKTTTKKTTTVKKTTAKKATTTKKTTTKKSTTAKKTTAKKAAK